ncbi:endonuclease/exonuclease/phosphatase family protein [Pelagicoccus sp. SDUM812003]|uniref:endonuclease/exonuclease/phosphatase family protein n=1 Tax=Pelagicoccus sp. SDUM812003 TaxID=3041267 RepID=UPI00280E977B|nr:endonuclease/exonuclease/phosphatase family protein [Pelagicoccus sp. SDUM812003]MDQ8204324.1 endonuclease/exonuclease/phosphatase family protein [Pelagicoccus sp. SDUM812003]
MKNRAHPDKLQAKLEGETARKAPGVILLQVDGLARRQFESALASGRLPFLQSMVGSGSHSLLSFYPGQPSSTPAVQAEIVYGKRCAVPAFSFYDAERGEDYRMYGAAWARRVSELASQEAASLLEGGGSYANIYSAGARRARYCGEQNTAGHWLEEISLLRLVRLAISYPGRAAKVIWLCLVEVLLAVRDCVKGVISRGDLASELKFVVARVGVSIALREAIRFRMMEGIKEGLPVLHANFFGYDEQAHRRGPESEFAHWSLKGIDGAIRKICRCAKEKGGREYSVIVFSDHGQESVVPYEEEHGESFDDKVQALFGENGFHVREGGALSAIMERAQYAARSLVGLVDDEEVVGKRWIRVKSMGPVAHIYVQNGLPVESKREWARRIVSESGIQIAFYRDELGDPVCVTEDGEGDLGLLLELLRACEHPFAREVVADTELMVKAGLSGDVIALGWRPGRRSLSFARERGAHGGPGMEECHGFALLPSGFQRNRSWVRGLDLRDAAFELSGRCPVGNAVTRTHPERPESEVLQLASYNVHGGVGCDRRLDPDRIAAVVSRLHADVVCFQEAFESADGRVSLESALRRRWCEDLSYDFLPLHEKRGVRYGVAIASKRPFRVVRSEGFELSDRRFSRLEPRGAQAVEFELSGERVWVANTHFGLAAGERQAQAKALLEDSWLGDAASKLPVALAGDFNAGPNSTTIELLRSRFKDTQNALEGRRTQASFLSWAPIRRIDHILTTDQWTVASAGSFQGRGARVASDHLPVFADLKLDTREAVSA